MCIAGSGRNVNKGLSQGALNARRAGNRVSVHFAVTFLDCWRTSFCVTTIINKHELVYGESSSNARDAQNVCSSFELLFTIFIIVFTQKLVLRQSKNVTAKLLKPYSPLLVFKSPWLVWAALQYTLFYGNSCYIPWFGRRVVFVYASLLY